MASATAAVRVFRRGGEVKLPAVIFQYAAEIGLAAFFLLCFFIQGSLTRKRLQRNAEEAKKFVTRRLDDMEMNLREMTVKEIRGVTLTSDSLRRSVREELNENLIFVREVADRIEPEQQASLMRYKEIKELFAKQGVYLHDEFERLAAGEETRMEKATEELSQRMQRLREEMVLQLSDRAREEQTLLQSSLQNAIQLINESVNRLTGEVDAKLSLLGENINSKFSAGLADTVESFHSLQQRVNELIATKEQMEIMGRDISSLSRLMLSRRDAEQTARLATLLGTALSDDDYTLSPTIGDATAAAALCLPGEEGIIVVDDGLALDEINNILDDDAGSEANTAARIRFDDVLTVRINAVADRFIAPPQTGNTALLFVSSETAYAEIQAHHRVAVELAATRRVWLVSPTTLMAVLNMARSIIKDYQARRQLEAMQTALRGVVAEAQAFEDRLTEISNHVGSAMRSVQRAESAGLKLFGSVRGAVEGNSLNLPPPHQQKNGARSK